MANKCNTYSAHNRVLGYQMHTLFPTNTRAFINQNPSRHRALLITKASTATPQSSNSTQSSKAIDYFKVAVFSAQEYVVDFMSPLESTFPNTTFIEVCSLRRQCENNPAGDHTTINIIPPCSHD